MTRLWILLAVMLIFSPARAGADTTSPAGTADFFGAPVMPGGKEVSRTDARLEKSFDAPPEKVLEFFKEALKDEKEVKFRYRASQTYVEDHAARQWHSITIEKNDKGGADVVWMKDNWTWILGTLILRFFGVFVVLLVLYLAMAISGAIISRALKRAEAEP
ncbi:MAG: hypothetical protein FJ118_16610 [Deltaproteobacteria bacterium]|nr:hypothetical protein [Deltaproteobacteria bacterium]